MSTGSNELEGGIDISEVEQAIQGAQAGAAQASAQPADEPSADGDLTRVEAKARKREVEAWADRNRDMFRSRREFNLAICDQLAVRGLPPLAGTLRAIGGRGAANAQAEDVAAWYADITRRLKRQDPDIPEVSRRLGIELLEQFWALARKDTEGRLVQPLRERLEFLESELAQERQRTGALQATLRETEAEVDTVSAKLNALTQESAQAAERDQRALESAHRQLEEALTAHASDVQRLAGEAAQQRESSARQVADLREQLDRQAQAAGEERTRLMRQVDEAQKSAREWQSLHETQARQAASATERLQQLTAEAAIAAAQRDAARSQVAALTQQLATAQARIEEQAAQAGQHQAKLAAAAAQEEMLVEENASLVKAGNALENCRLYAARHKSSSSGKLQDEDWTAAILRFCEEGGATGSALRQEARRRRGLT